MNLNFGIFAVLMMYSTLLIGLLFAVPARRYLLRERKGSGRSKTLSLFTAAICLGVVPFVNDELPYKYVDRYARPIVLISLIGSFLLLIASVAAARKESGVGNDILLTGSWVLIGIDTLCFVAMIMGK